MQNKQQDAADVLRDLVHCRIPHGFRFVRAEALGSPTAAQREFLGILRELSQISQRDALERVSKGCGITVSVFDRTHHNIRIVLYQDFGGHAKRT